MALQSASAPRSMWRAGGKSAIMALVSEGRGWPLALCRGSVGSGMGRLAMEDSSARQDAASSFAISAPTPAVASMCFRPPKHPSLVPRVCALPHQAWVPRGAERQGNRLLCLRRLNFSRAFMSPQTVASSAVQVPNERLQVVQTRGDRRRLSSQAPEQGSHSPRIWTVPNMICMARIAATPGIAYLAVLGHYDLAFCGLVAAGLSDGLDGYIARNYDQKSVLGSYLDPFSDKILINSLALACALPGVGLLPGWVVGIIFLRDASLIGAAVWVARKKTSERGEPLFAGTMKANSPLQIKASMMSKVNTVLQLSMLAAALGGASSFAPVGFATIVEPIAYATACTTAATMAEYVLWPGYHQGKT